MTTTAGFGPPPSIKDDKFVPPLRLGPVAKSQTFVDNRASLTSYWPPLSSQKAQPTSTTRYPRIVVKDPTGRILDTFTTLQEAIYRASWSRKKMGEWPKIPLQWRLPKAPVPSKPDYSRAGPRAATSLNFVVGHTHYNKMTSSHDVTSNARRLELTADVLVNVPTVEIPVDDVAFVAESLNHLPNLPSFTFLRHSLLAGRSTYVQIVASILLHQRQLRAIDRREADWEFPGFCKGCKRAGFCYGCSKNPKPHVHEDIPAMTGGGFRFWKRDRPRDPHGWKHPSNWRLPSTEQELCDIIEQYGGLAAYEQAVMRARRAMAMQSYDREGDVAAHGGIGRGSRYQRLKNLGTYPPCVTIVSTDEFGTYLRDGDDAYGDMAYQEDMDLQRPRKGSVEEEEQLYDQEEDVEDEEEEDEEEEVERQRVFSDQDKSESIGSEQLERQDSDGSVDRTLVRVDTGYFDEMSEDDQKEGRGRVSIVDPSEDEDLRNRENGTGSHSSRVQATSSHTQSDSGHSPSRSKGQVTSNKISNRFEFVDKQKELEEETEARLRREPPKFFTVQKRQRRITMAKDPFSTDRELNVPKGPSFQLKKSGKKSTQFIDFRRGDRSWKAPKKFELTHGDTEDEGKGRRKLGDGEDGRRRGGRGDGEGDDQSRRRRKRDLSPDSGLDSATTGGKDGRNRATDLDGKDTGLSQTDADALNKDNKAEDEGDFSGKTGTGGDRDGSTTGKPKRREVVKKTRIERVSIVTPPESPTRLPSPPLFKRRSPTQSPSPPRSPTPQAEEPPLPEFVIPTIPDLPDIEEKSPEKRKQKQKFIVEPPPPLPPVKDEPKRRRPPPKIRMIPRHLSRPRKSRPAEAPVTSEELMDIEDPLDFLAKWCIINPDRLPFYEIVFESTVAEQEQRYIKHPPWQQDKNMKETKEELQEAKENENEGKKKKGKSKKKKSSKEKDRKEDQELNPSLLPTERGLNVQKVAMTIEEQHLEKLIYTLDILQEKMYALGAELAELEAIRIKKLANKARETYPHISAPDYAPKKKKGKKGKKKEKKSAEPPRRLRPEEITNEVIVDRLDDKQLHDLCREQDMRILEVEIERLREKIREVQGRVEEIASEKLLADAFCMNHFFMRQGLQNQQSDEFKRQQSELYNRLHPDPDYEMNLDEVEGALQQINNHLLTEKEFHFLYSILNLPGRERINFRLFSVIAALSEKVTQLDPVIRKLINNFNYNALDIKMEKCKELFDLLEADHMPRGAAQAASLAVELTAGGMKPEHTSYVLNKFNRESKGSVDFLDFVTYVPLFVEIHKRIIQDPLKDDLDL